VTLSTPNHGIGFALPGRWIKVARLLSPHSAFLNKLNEPDETYGNVLYTCIWSTEDYTQKLPWASGRLKDAYNYVIHGTTHAGMLTDPRLLPAIEKGLDRRPGEPVGPEQTID
jgi:hypothetical protein